MEDNQKAKLKLISAKYCKPAPTIIVVPFFREKILVFLPVWNRRASF